MRRCPLLAPDKPHGLPRRCLHPDLPNFNAEHLRAALAQGVDLDDLARKLGRETIAREDLVAEFYEPDAFTRQSDEEITLFKNGGGAHLDLMTSRYILDAWQKAQ